MKFPVQQRPLDHPPAHIILYQVCSSLCMVRKCYKRAKGYLVTTHVQQVCQSYSAGVNHVQSAEIAIRADRSIYADFPVLKKPRHVPCNGDGTILPSSRPAPACSSIYYQIQVSCIDVAHTIVSAAFRDQSAMEYCIELRVVEELERP